MALKRILVVHPAADIGRRISALLHRTGQFATKGADDGFGAAARIFNESFDGLILHLSTAGLDPARVIQQIRSTGVGAQMPILILARGLSDDSLRALFRRSSGITVLEEPFGEEQFLQAVRRMFGLESAEEAAHRPVKRGRRKLRRRPGRLAVQHRWAAAKPQRSRAGLADAIIRDAQRGADLPGMPPWVSRLDSLVADLTGNFVSKEIVAFDLSLAVTILRMANSTYYRAIEPIACLSRAMGRLGQRAVARLLVNSWSARSEVPEPTQGFLLNTFWKHNLLVACLAEETARSQRFLDHSAVFSAGLLHDVGKLFMMRHFPTEYMDVIHRTRPPREGPSRLLDPSDTEREILGVDHGLVGYELCRGWFLPPIVAAGTLHHQLDSDRTRLLVDARVTRMVAFADLVARFMEPRQPPEDPGMQGTPESDRDRGEQDLPRLRMRMSHIPLDSTAAERSFDEFLYDAAPLWAQRYVESSHLPIEQIVTRADRRVNKAVREVGLAA